MRIAICLMAMALSLECIGQSRVPNYTVPTAISADGLGDIGRRFVDVDRDGFEDLVVNRWIDGNNQQKWAYRNTGSGWEKLGETYVPPANLAADGLGDIGRRFVDVDHDGFKDLVFNRWIGQNNVEKGAYRNTGSGWEKLGETYVPPANLAADGLGDIGRRFVDVDHDGFKDLVFNRWIDRNNVQKGAYRNTGSGWEKLGDAYLSPVNLAADELGNLGSRFVDIDHDGFEDLVVHRWIDGDNQRKAAYRNTGSGWEKMGDAYVPPFHLAADGIGDLGARFVDVDHDGFKDLIYHRYVNESRRQVGAYRNTGSGWEKMGDAYAPPFHLTADEIGDLGARFVDVDHDGFKDLIYRRYVNESRIQLGAYRNTGSGWEEFTWHYEPEEMGPALELRYVADLQRVWDDNSSGAKRDVAMYRPLTPKGFHTLAHRAMPNRNGPKSALGLIVARALIPGALAPPVGYRNIWEDTGSGANLNGSVWEPIPPQGYVSLGSIVLPNHQWKKPRLDAVMCVRKELVVAGKLDLERNIWDDKDSGSHNDFSAWKIVPEKTTEGEYGIDIGAFVGHRSHVSPRGPFYCLSSIGFSLPQIDGGTVSSLIEQHGPIIEMGAHDPYRPDDPSYILDHSELRWGLGFESAKYGTLGRAIELGKKKTSARDLLNDVASVESLDSAGNSQFSHWIEIPDELKGGSEDRAKAFVRVKPLDGVFVSVQFWIFYPYNGPGKSRLKVGAVIDETFATPPAGEHYGDWESVSLRFSIDSEREDSFVLSQVHLSRHSAEEVLSAGDPKLQYQGGHPVIYSAHGSHAHYTSGGAHRYERAKSLNIGIGHVTVDLYDFAGNARPPAKSGFASPARSFQLNTFEPDRYQVVSSAWCDVPVDQPGWLLYEGRWGQFREQKFEVCFNVPLFGRYCEGYKEIGNGPTGPILKSLFSERGHDEDCSEMSNGLPGAPVLPPIVLPPVPGARNGIDSVTRNGDGTLSIRFYGTLSAGPSVTGPFLVIPGARSPHVVEPRAQGQFYIAR